MSPWTEIGHLEYQRDIKFLKPVNLPGLASTRGVKYQHYQRFGDHGLVLSSSTRLEDVPCADCFSVEDILTVCSDGDGEHVLINISFEVVFMKSTFMRSMIEGPTEREMKKWLEAFYAHLKEVIESKESKQELKEIATEESQNDSTSSLDSTKPRSRSIVPFPANSV
jgi:hypothetical protein